MNRKLEEIKPTRGKLLGEVIEGDYTTDSGIIVVESMKKKKPRKCLIVAIGGPFEDKKGKPQQYRAKLGQTAYFKMAEGEKMTINRKNYLMLENEDIVAVEE